MEKKHETDSNALHLAEEVEESAAEPQTKKKRVDTYYDDQANYASIVKKDELTLMVRQLHPRTGEFDLFELFSKKGKVIDVKLVKDERSNRCIGVAYVEMSADTEVDNALTLNGEPLCGSHIVVQRSMALKNRMASAGATAHEIKMASTALNDPSTASQVAAAAGTGVVPPGMAGIIRRRLRRAGRAAAAAPPLKWAAQRAASRCTSVGSTFPFRSFKCARSSRRSASWSV